MIRNPDFAEYLGRSDSGELYELDSPLTEGQRLALRLVTYGNNRRMLLLRDTTRLHTLEEMRKDFVANVSHGLRSPLTVMVGYLEGMRDDEDLPQRHKRPVDQMWQQAERMWLIVDDLLRFSRIESDPGGAAHLPVRVSEMLESIRRDANRIGTGAHVLDVQADQDLQLIGAYNELYSAFSNLVLNAVQYTPEQGRISVIWTQTEEGARLEVGDTGVGIEPHHIPRLTERFYRVDKARSREIGGTGLGLAIVKHVLMRHDAQLQVESEPGQGSTFSWDFPASRIEQAGMRVSATG